MRFLAVGVVAVALATGAMACLIAYSNYDNRFQSDASTNGPTAFVTDDGGAIAALAVTSTDLFYAVNDAIKRVPLDGGVATTWWTEDAGVTDLASDRASTIAWSAKQVVRKATVNAPASSIVVTPNVGAFNKLAANASGLAWFQGNQTTCPCTLGGVELWDSSTPSPLTYDVDASKVAPADVAIDDQGVTLFTPGVGVRRYALDGTFSCAQGAGVRSTQGILHAIATGASGDPFFAIGSPSGTLAAYATTCTQENSPGGPTALAILDDGSNIFWLTNTSALCSGSLDGGACVDVPAGTVNAMTFDDAWIYLAIDTGIYRIAKP